VGWWLQKFEGEGDDRGGSAQRLERGGGCTRWRGLGGGLLGLGGLVGRIEFHGPTRSHDSSRPQLMSLTKNSTILLVNASQNSKSL
jgi:hypothetical protein